MFGSILRRACNGAQSCCRRWGRRAGFASAAGGGRLAGKVALITGGASGLGLATAREFVRQGARVVVADLNPKLGESSIQEVGSDTAFVKCDVTVERELAEAVDFAVSLHGKLDVMYNSAGITGSSSPAGILDLDMAEFDRVMSVNVRGTVLGIKHAARVMVPRGSGSILCTASIAGILGRMGYIQYSISKSAVLGTMKMAASELCQAGIRVNCISPFAIATPMVVEQLSGYYQGASKEKITEVVAGLGELKGVSCEEGDIAKAAVYLASDEARFVSGLNLVVDGAFTCYKSLNLPRPEDVL